jgi:predicted nucleic acid-binding protein
MLAVDTNVLIRYLTGDDPEQSPRARRLIEGDDVWVPVTVLLETEWVLRSVYGYPATQIASALRMFAGLPRIALENPSVVAQALDWAERGMDFADALHLGTAAQCEAFVTFDIGFIKAARTSGVSVRVP